MKQLKFYKYTIAGLALLNAAILIFFVINRPHSPRPSGPTNNFHSDVIEILNLNAQQAIDFESIANKHHDKMTGIKQQQQQLLVPFFQQLSDSTVLLNKQDVLNKFQLLEKEKIEVTYDHLKDIKGLLLPEQLPNFKLFTQNFIENVVLGKKKNGPPPKDFK